MVSKKCASLTEIILGLDSEQPTGAQISNVLVNVVSYCNHKYLNRLLNSRSFEKRGTFHD